uniref:Uncharacterized protein n=1 Tax=Cacopsylla melanoneura TaxID=428564 RepID=A0A8D9B8T0_9HEMI
MAGICVRAEWKCKNKINGRFLCWARPSQEHRPTPESRLHWTWIQHLRQHEGWDLHQGCFTSGPCHGIRSYTTRRPDHQCPNQLPSHGVRGCSDHPLLRFTVRGTNRDGER